ncbi:extracellular solute-binding protein, partial [Streptomyces sp. NPDC000851]
MSLRRLALVCVSVSLVGACGLVPQGGGTERRTVTVWLMKDSASKDFLERFTEEFERTHGDLDLDIRIQEWTGIGEKVQAALETDATGAIDGPDVIEVGNTQVPQYVEGGGLLDLTLESLRDWGMRDWLP